MQIMDPEVKALWVKELRSGDFTQGYEQLRYGKKCCCLGVLCELGIEQGLPIEVGEYGNTTEYDGCRGMPPISVSWAWAKVPYWALARLASMNDARRLTFQEIADWIEANL